MLHWRERRAWRRRLVATDYGRSQGWEVVLDGRVVAWLDEPVWDDMFWHSYRIVPRSDDEALATKLRSEMFWCSPEALSLRFRSRALGLFARAPFAAPRFSGPLRVRMRGLYIGPDQFGAERAGATAGGRLRGLIRALRRLIGGPDGA